ncbi:LysR family transcriptional regulator [Devosia yakushimensis]|uniref:LysR family transcriptional regulator n=1 Tax=Devosia yakushimensis TaxID=470028 RepID=A0ABQ5UJG9_9HYPH|nr:LysR family transcriptional regulator ArgP [Devosia yakushimensis]GLQ12121.1 LysR family transcriptional regulator [Devosia yakushimensis]
MIDYPAALAVAAVVRTGSFENAAKALHVTPSAVSQRVKHLEERLGVALIERGNPCIATEKGARLCRHMELVGALENSLLDYLPELGERGTTPVTLDIAVNSDSLGTWFLSAAADLARSSNILLNIAVDDQDHTVDWLRRGRVVAAVTSRSEPVTGCRATPLGKLQYRATASPAFLRHYLPNGASAVDMAKAPALTFNQKDSMQQDWLQTFLGITETVPTHWLPSTQGFVDACLLGLGWCLNPTALVQEHLASGRLVELVPDATVDVALHWQVSRMAAHQFPQLDRSIVSAARATLLRD